MSELSAKHDKLLKLAELSLGEISTLAETGDKDEVEACVEKVTGLIKQLEISVEKTKQAMLDGDVSLEDIMSWSNSQMTKLKHFRGVRSQFKETLVDKQRDEDDRKFRREVEKQRAINEEAMRARVQEQKELDAIAEQRIQREQEWLARKIQMEKEAQEQMHDSSSGASTTTTQSVKLQKYTITPFEGDYKDWIRFWNQFSVEVDGATISEISKFNYLLELTKGKPREDILGLPHTEEGYKEAKRILKSIYGKDIKVQRALIKELENLPVITSVRKTADIHEFYNKLSRVVRTLTTMGKLNSCQSMVYSLLDKLGPVREILAQTDDKWEEWKLEELTENLRKTHWVRKSQNRIVKMEKGTDEGTNYFLATINKVASLNVFTAMIRITRPQTVQRFYGCQIVERFYGKINSAITVRVKDMEHPNAGQEIVGSVGKNIIHLSVSDRSQRWVIKIRNRLL